MYVCVCVCILYLGIYIYTCTQFVSCQRYAHAFERRILTPFSLRNIQRFQATLVFPFTLTRQNQTSNCGITSKYRVRLHIFQELIFWLQSENKSSHPSTWRKKNGLAEFPFWFGLSKRRAELRCSPPVVLKSCSSHSNETSPQYLTIAITLLLMFMFYHHGFKVCCGQW